MRVSAIVFAPLLWISGLCFGHGLMLCFAFSIL
nr:MAG TPA: FAM176 family [Caudoviricetes sp.]